MDDKKNWVLTPLGRLVTQVIVLVFGIVSVYLGTGRAVKNSIDEGFRETVEKAVEEDFNRIEQQFEKMNTKIVVLQETIQKIQDQMDSEFAVDVITTIKKQAGKIKNQDWVDIHEPDISKSIGGFAKLRERKYDSGELAKLEADINLINLYNNGKIGPKKH